VSPRLAGSVSVRICQASIAHAFPAVTVHLPVRRRNRLYFQRGDHSFSRISQVVLWKPRLTISIIVSSQPSCQQAATAIERALPQLQPPAFTAPSGLAGLGSVFRRHLQAAVKSSHPHPLTRYQPVWGRHRRWVCMEDGALQLLSEAGRIASNPIKHLTFITILLPRLLLLLKRPYPVFC